MYVKRVCYPVHVLGPGKRIGIWFAGCRKRCVGCMSPELQTIDGCNNVSVDSVLELLNKITGPIDGITISGGEPFIQSDALSVLVQHIAEHITQDIIVYTGYTLQELQQSHSPDINNVLDNIAVLIDGEYNDSLNDGVGLRGSSNQKVHVFKNLKNYDYLNTGERELQTFRYNDSILVIGIQ